MKREKLKGFAGLWVGRLVNAEQKSLRMPLGDNFGVSDFAFLEQNVVQLKTGANNNLK